MNRTQVSFMTIFLLYSHAAWAQDDSTRATSLNEVVITATRFPKKISETGKVVSVISKKDIESSNGKDLAQLLSEQAGVLVNSAYSNPGKDKSIYLRGASTDYIVILVDGIPVSDPSGTGGAFDIRMFPLEQVERIEILKGAQSTLYGSDAIAGVINIITKKTTDKPAQAYGGLAGGSYKTFKADAGIYGAAEGSAYNIGFTQYKTDGISEAADTTTAVTFDRDGFTRNAFHANFDARVVNGLHIKPYFRYAHFKGGYDGGAYTDAVSTYEAQMITTGAQAQYSFANGGLTAFYNYDEVSRTFSEIYGVYPYKGNKNSLELYAHYSFNPHLQLLAGLQYNKQKMNDETATPKNPIAELTSPYLSFFVRDLAGFNLELGGRYNKHSAYGDNFTYSINPSFTFNNAVKIFANYATAFKAPSLQALYGPFSANADLAPETSATMEAGIQATLFSGLIDARAVYFRRNIENVIVYGPSFQLINLNKQKDHGFEFEPTVYVNKQLTLKLFYAYADGKVTTMNNDKDSTYSNLIRRPKHSFGINAAYQFTPQFFVSTQISSYGKRSDLYYDAATFSQKPAALAAYALWNAYASYGFVQNRIKLFVDVKNIADVKYTEVYGYSTQEFNITGGIRINI